jgi:hypothetical protein
MQYILKQLEHCRNALRSIQGYPVKAGMWSFLKGTPSFIKSRFDSPALFIGGIILLLFFHFIPVGIGEPNNIYNKPEAELMAIAGNKKIVMAPNHNKFILKAKRIKIKDVKDSR